MATINKFNIENFKGIKQLEIDITEKNTAPVLTLIGLNESGKTTILEALSHFISADKSVQGLFDDTHEKSSGLGLIPIHRKAGFTEHVKIEALISLDDEDINELNEIAKNHKKILDTNALKQQFEVSKRFEFIDSELDTPNSYWSIPIFVKSLDDETFEEYKRPESRGIQRDLWQDFVNHIHNKLPKVLYFPTFLVDLPSRIYLEEHRGETAVNRHYRLVLQSILDSLSEDLELTKHVCHRIRNFQNKSHAQDWFSLLLGSAEKSPIDSVFHKISAAITKEILGSWRRVLKKPTSINRIAIDWSVDSENNHMPYASIFVSDGESKYAVTDRSLGFRWFFSFLIFTAFNKANRRKAIFIFDEPAANLHAKAQAELLKSFSRIASDGNIIIYSTHSHHMINPKWLGAAYIIENAALDYDNSDNFNLHIQPTDISATPYRQFVSSFPSRSSYFQPVIESLEYIPPEIIGEGPYLIVEGISDYYSLEIARKSLSRQLNYSIIPGVGSGAADPIISQLIGRGHQFVILLDDDNEGKKAAARYKDTWYLGDKQVMTLADIDSNFKGSALEKLLCEETIKSIQASLTINSPPSKKQIGWFLAEACARDTNEKVFFSPKTLSNFEKILDGVDNALI